MARKLTVEELVADGVDKAVAERVVATQNTPKPRIIWWQFRGTEKEAAQVAKQFSNLQIVKRYQTREKGARADK